MATGEMDQRTRNTPITTEDPYRFVWTKRHTKIALDVSYMLLTGAILVYILILTATIVLLQAPYNDNDYDNRTFSLYKNTRFLECSTQQTLRDINCDALWYKLQLASTLEQEAVTEVISLNHQATDLHDEQGVEYYKKNGTLFLDNKFYFKSIKSNTVLDAPYRDRHNAPGFVTGSET
jgi:hypothetical protein